MLLVSHFLLVNIASVLVTPPIFCLATGAIISGVREAGANQA
ncbi:putative membrane protein [Escherichia coli DEC4F]|nr:putative membrane protein [Escherichia coli DEC4F]